MLASLLASVGVPIITDLLKSIGPAVSRKFFGLSVDDEIKLEGARTERLKAIAELDSPGGVPSTWVVDLRASFRYISAGALILGGLGMAGYGAFVVDPALVAGGLEMAGFPFGFIFGERLVLSYKPNGK